MAFQPVIPLGGVAGWAFLNRTRPQQEASFAASPMQRNDIEHLRARFDSLGSVQDLVNDRRALRVVLGAYGLDDDLANRAFIARVISDGVEDRRALSNRLADNRYKALARDFQHLSVGAADSAVPDGLAERVITQFQRRSFEQAVGKQDQTMRLAMNLERELPDVIGAFSNDNARWFALLGNPPLRKALETALNLPTEFGALDIDQQVTRLKASAKRQFNVSDVKQLADPAILERVVQRFLVMSQLRDMQANYSPAAVALSLLSVPR